MAVSGPKGDRGVLYLAKVAVIAGAYYGSAKVGLDLAFATKSVTAIWPPTGIALAALVIWGRSVWPGVALGAFLANLWTGVPLITVLGITTGNTLEAVVGAYLLSWVADFRPSLERLRDVLALVVLAGIISTAIAATIGVTSLIIGNEVSFDDFGSVWRVWWLGDMGGDLLVAPVLMVFAATWPFRKLPGRGIEAIALAVSLVGLSIIVFHQETSFAYLIFPLLIWATLRFWQPGATLAVLVVTGIAVYYTNHGDGPFVRSDPDDSLLLAQTFFGVAALTMMSLAAVITERAHAQETIAYIAGALQEGLLPAGLPEIPGIDLAARFRPVGEDYRVGGDFYDVFESRPGRWVVVVGDVSGKGPNAAAVTAWRATRSGRRRCMTTAQVTSSAFSTARFGNGFHHAKSAPSSTCGWSRPTEGSLRQSPAADIRSRCSSGAMERCRRLGRMVSFSGRTRSLSLPRAPCPCGQETHCCSTPTGSRRPTHPPTSPLARTFIRCSDRTRTRARTRSPRTSIAGCSTSVRQSRETTSRSSYCASATKPSRIARNWRPEARECPPSDDRALVIRGDARGARKGQTGGPRVCNAS